MMSSSRRSPSRFPKSKRRHNKLRKSQNMDDSPWNQPPDQSGWDVEDTSFLDIKTSEHQDHVDGPTGLVTFWLRGVEAAEKGQQVSRMAEYFDDVDAQDAWAWGSAGGVQDAEEEWGAQAEDWGDCADAGWWGVRKVYGGGWGDFAHKDSGISDETDRIEDASGRKRQREGGSESDGVPREVQDLVSKVAHDARPERRRQLYDFVQMGTEEKVQKIQEMVYRLGGL